MWPWLKAIGVIVLLIAVSVALGTFEALAVGLVLGFFAKLEDPKATRRMRVGLLLIWFGAFVITSSVASVALGPQSTTRRKLIRHLYDLNCSAPFQTYRYPRSVIWLSEGSLHSATWDAILVCKRWIIDALSQWRRRRPARSATASARRRLPFYSFHTAAASGSSFSSALASRHVG